MEFTFGIITYKDADTYIEKIVESIRVQKIPIYEIIIIGETNVIGSDIINIKFDETIKAGWITRKKNIIAKEAKYENIVLLHDYVCFDKDWSKGFLKYGSDFDICVNCIETKDGKRFRDYLIFHQWIPPFRNGHLLPYDFVPSINISKIMYISGTFYVIKKHIALKYPLNEDLLHNMGEDVVLSHMLSNDNIILKCNKYSCVFLLKDKHDSSIELTIDEMNILHNLDDDYLLNIFEKQKYMQKKWLFDEYKVRI
jgi:hypothetical protein